MAVNAIRPVPSALPYAHIYVDDLEEIIAIFGEALARDLNNSAPSVSFSTEDLRFDSIDDLLEHGGSTKYLNIRVSQEHRSCSIRFFSTLEPRVELYSLQEGERWAVYGRVKAIFDRRKYWLKNALHDLPGWLEFMPFWGPWLLLLVPLFLHLAKFWLFVWLCVWLVSSVGGLAVVMQPSRVSFVHSRDRWKQGVERRREYLRDIFMFVLGGIIGQMIEYAAKRFLK